MWSNKSISVVFACSLYVVGFRIFSTNKSDKYIHWNIIVVNNWEASFRVVNNSFINSQQAGLIFTLNIWKHLPNILWGWEFEFAKTFFEQTVNVSSYNTDKYRRVSYFIGRKPSLQRRLIWKCWSTYLTSKILFYSDSVSLCYHRKAFFRYNTLLNWSRTRT